MKKEVLSNFSRNKARTRAFNGNVSRAQKGPSGLTEKERKIFKKSY